MIAILYRWKLKPGREREFVEGWEAITKHYLENAQSLGSRLHKGDDDTWYAYAQWPSEDVRLRAFAGADLADAAEKMRSAIAERFPEVRLEVAADHLAVER